MGKFLHRGEVGRIIIEARARDDDDGDRKRSLKNFRRAVAGGRDDKFILSVGSIAHNRERRYSFRPDDMTYNRYRYVLGGCKVTRDRTSGRREEEKKRERDRKGKKTGHKTHAVRRSNASKYFLGIDKARTHISKSRGSGGKKKQC